ncbi:MULTISPECIES: proline dehydrogenase family protein [unclassified Mycolicibacterium]|uniref:proline dehydrogenase family protein n=1 Tax=unclassified Mycolicibacterium TaxID=2636767 RepID=UPI002ED921CC
MTPTPDILGDAAEVLRRWALDESLKAKTLANPALANAAAQIAARYTAGPIVDNALNLLATNAGRGHLGSVEYVGESVRETAVANRATAEFVYLADRLKTHKHDATISFDLSHVGSVISPDLGLLNATQIAQAARESGTYIMISAEGSGRTDLVLDLYERLSVDFPETGVTLQARLHRTPADLQRISALPGPVRVVKGAFLESESVAYPRNSPDMYEAYQSLVADLVRSGRRVNIATHDDDLVRFIRDDLGEDLRGEHVEFETLQGLGTALLDSLRDESFSTREYVVYGPDWWLYVLNRIAEHPQRAIVALADLNHPDGS